MSKRAFTLILPYYENPGQLARQIHKLCDLPEDVRGRLHLIVVDDGSPKSPVGDEVLGTRAALPPAEGGLASFRAFRIDVDIRWNWLAARNIGVHHTKTEWVLLTDIDLELPEATARALQEKKMRIENVYRFGRVTAPDMTPYKPHPNSWFMTRQMFDKVGGYDERFSGFYGTDGEFRDRVRANCSRLIVLEEFPLVRVPRELVPDASTTTYGRKEAQDHEGVTRIRREIAAQGGPTKRLSFPYHQIV